jgi:GNAT superfamily N-acetyltransferase
MEIKKISSKRELKEFVSFPIKLYKNHPCYVPPLIFDELNTFNPSKNPALEFCEVACFVAKEGKTVLGRIAVILNTEANKRFNEEHVRFGWFDVVDNPEVTKALMETAADWARQRGMKAIKGPMGVCDFDNERMLMHGFEQLGTFATLYNYPYYPVHLEQLGFRKEVDWKEFQIAIPESLNERYFRFSELLAQKYGLRVISCKSNKELVRRYGQKIFQLLNDSYQVLYGYVPLNEKQVDYYIKLYLSFVRPELVSLIITPEDRVVGVGISLPSMSKAFQKAKGKLFPFGFIHILKAIRKNDLLDLYLMGVHPEYQGKGLNSLIFTSLLPKFQKNGYRMAESNPELETNARIQALWSEFNPRHHKTRRVYIKEI